MPPTIVFLDAATVDYGDINFAPIAALGSFHAHPLTRTEEVAGRLKEADAAITNKVVLDVKIMNECPRLRLIAVAATGTDNIAMDAARSRGITVANVPGYSTFSVAQLTMAFILAMATNMIRYDRACRGGTWSRSPVFTLGTWPTFDLEGKTLGILGMGAIGREVARLAMAFGMRVLALKRDGVVYDNGFDRLGLHGLAERSDFISIHLPLTEESRHLIGGDFLKTMKRTAFLINMARGPIVDPAALAHALETGTIKGAALDVMEQEPPAGNDPLLSAPNLIVTPHIAWASLESRRRLVGEIAANIAAFSRGEKRNVVS